MNDDIIYGRNPVIEALEAGNTAIDRILLQDGLKHSQIVYIRKIAKEHGIQYKFADKRRLDSACGGENHQGVIAHTAAHKYAEIEDIFAAAAEKGEAPFIVLTDGITDPHNLGSIIRTANAAGAHGVIIPKNRNAALNAVVSKVSAGAVEYTPVARVTNLKSTIEKLKKQGNLFKSTKGDGHGLGLIRIDDIVKRSDGYISRNSEDGAFTTEILLPQL